MAKYVLFYSGGSMPETQEEQATIMQAWTTWYGTLGSALVDPGNPFTGQAKTIANDGTVSDGAGEKVGSGYSIINVDSLDAATALAKGCPVLLGGAQITVFETFEVM